MGKPAYEEHGDSILAREVRNAGEQEPEQPEGTAATARGGSVDDRQSDALRSTGTDYVGGPGRDPIGTENVGGDGRGGPGQETGI